MASFAVVISDPGTKKSYQTQLEQDKGVSLIGKKITDDISGDILGLSGYTLKITGGSDKDGFPMHPAVLGQGRKRALLIKPPGFHPKFDGERRRKTVRGNTISSDIVQINCRVVKKGEKTLEEVFPPKAKEGDGRSTEAKPS